MGKDKSFVTTQVPSTKVPDSGLNDVRAQKFEEMLEVFWAKAPEIMGLFNPLA